MSDPDPIAAFEHADIAFCPGCGVPSLVNNLPGDCPALQCPRCGTVLRPCDINRYELVSEN